MPDTNDYLTRIRDYAQGKDPLELQKQTPTVLTELVAKTSDEQLTKRLSTDKWSVGEILAHLAEDEIATAWRYRQMVEQLIGESCATGLVKSHDPIQMQVVQEWLNEFERVQWILRLSPRLRQRHGD